MFRPQNENLDKSDTGSGSQVVESGRLRHPLLDDLDVVFRLDHDVRAVRVHKAGINRGLVHEQTGQNQLAQAREAVSSILDNLLF